ncbi:hypothetical protein DMUE_1752 [Dictyocoela muelleri]|nr:hypothetical protein DMUE_1752 [Dictyocoela muelleri]
MNLKEKYDSFTSFTELNEETYKELLRLCGYAPTENVGEIPKSFEEFQDKINKFKKEYSADDLYKQLRSFNSGDDLIKKDDLFKLLASGDKLNNDELCEFEKLVVVDENDMISLRSVVDILLEE